VPQTADFRIMRFNITTFDYCRKKGYDIHYPPVYKNFFLLNIIYIYVYTYIYFYFRIKLISNFPFLFINITIYFKPMSNYW